jgi:glycosyltransferase involved in cell wall biosynthesis
MKTTVYIGRFTPTGGGVTEKNRIIYEALSSIIQLRKIDVALIKKGHLASLILLIFSLFRRNGRLIIGTSKRRFFSYLLYTFNRSTMNNSILIVMGGQFGNIVASDAKYQRWVKGYKMIYVETIGMMEALHSVGVKNVSIFPNCRKKPEIEIRVKPRVGRLKCVCFSMIYPEKGIDIVLQAARHLPDVSFDFWGVIREDYRNDFLTAVRDLPNCNYRGVYRVEGDNVYALLNQYDLLLFPTRLMGEGVPGTLVEAKISGLPAVVSDVAHNALIVENGISGIVMRRNEAESLIEAIKAADDEDFLIRLKCGAKESGERYFFEGYLRDLVFQINGEG